MSSFGFEPAQAHAQALALRLGLHSLLGYERSGSRHSAAAAAASAPPSQYQNIHDLPQLGRLSIEILSYLSLDDLLRAAQVHAQNVFQFLSSLASTVCGLVPFKPVLKWCLSYAYTIYVEYPFEIAAVVRQKFGALLKLMCRRSNGMRLLLIHTLCLYEIAIKVLQDLLKSSPKDLLLWVMQMATYVWNNQQKDVHGSGDLRWTDFVDLLAYEEHVEDVLPANIQRRMKRMMHHSVPAHKFRATVRSRKRSEDKTERDTNEYLDDAQCIDMCTPVSFPPTPFSRARVMSHSAERVESIMYGARDRLRLEELSRHDDMITRERASELQERGQLAVFDPYQTSEGIALSCGNHCALKVGRAMCCSTRAMVALRKECFVYTEFIINVQRGVTPSLVVGLSPPDCPLNVMVGSWPRSIGLYSEGQLLVGSSWFSSVHRQTWGPGTTIGMLTYIRDPTAPHSVSEALGKAAAEIQALAGQASDRGSGTHSTRLHVRFSDDEVLSGSTSSRHTNLQAYTDNSRNTSLSLHGLLVALGLRRTPIRVTQPIQRVSSPPPPSPTTPPENEVPITIINTGVGVTVGLTAAPATNEAMQTGPDAGAGVGSSGISNVQMKQAIDGDVDAGVMGRSALGLTTHTFSQSVMRDISESRKSESETSAKSSGSGESKLSSPPPPQMLVSGQSPSSVSISQPQPLNFFCLFSVNGEVVHFPPQASAASNDVTNLNAPLTPTVSILSSDTRVWCRFCDADVIYRTRAQIGAPPNVPVYCLDGSLLLATNED